MNGGKVHVLVVDDDKAIRDALRLTLEDEDYAVAEAADGAQALDALRSSAHQQVVLLDFRMPRVDGGDVLNAIDMDSRLARRHAFILITANRNTLPLSLVTLLDRMEVPILPKPFDMDELLEAVAAAARRLFPPTPAPAPPSLDVSH